jgi:aryl-alcohol dehydrogenase-like predicted oxidoreductase
MQELKPDRRGFLKAGSVAGAALLGRSVSAESSKDTRAAGSPGTTTSSMPTRNLGKTGHKIAIFSLGGQSALEHSNNEAVAIPIIERALDLGVNYIDTSSIYGGPTRPSERYIGQVLNRRRHETFVATKTKERTRDGSMRMIEESLRLLQTDYVDIWQLHDIGTQADVDQVFAKDGAMEALLQARDQKIVRFLGITGHHRPDALSECIRRFPFDNILMGFNAADKHEHSFADELLPLAVERQMGIVGMKIPARGRLLASLTPPSLDRQKHMWEGGANLTTQPGTLSMREALYYVWSHPVSTVIVGIDSLAQLEENVKFAREFTPLSAQQMNDLTAKTAMIAKQALWFRNFERA